MYKLKKYKTFTLMQHVETSIISTKLSLSIKRVFCVLFYLYMYYNSVLLYLDSSTFRVRSEGVSIVTVRH